MMLLLNPYTNPDAQPKVSDIAFFSCPTSLGFLAAYMKKHAGFTPKIVDEQIEELNHESLSKYVLELPQPRIVGISTMTLTFKRGRELAVMVKEIAPETIIIMGGVHPTLIPEEVVEVPEVDFVVKGEGEVTLYELYTALSQGKDPSAIEGIWYKKEGKVIKNPDRPLVENLDDFPMFYDIFKDTYKEYKNFGAVISSRGCPYDCVFCSQRQITGRSYRYVSNDRAFLEIKTLIEDYGQDFIYFQEDNFLIHKKRVFDLLDRIIKAGYHKRCDFVAQFTGKAGTPEVMRKLKEANFQIIMFGVETGVNRLMDIVGKGMKVEDYQTAITNARNAGLQAQGSFIFGIPGETHEDRMNTLKAAMKMPLDSARFNLMTPYPGTRVYNIAKEEKTLNITKDWGNCGNQYYLVGDDLPYVPKGENRYELMFDLVVANFVFNMRPQIIIRNMKARVAGAIFALPPRWWLSPHYLSRVGSVAWQLGSRMAYITFKAMQYKFFVKPFAGKQQVQE